MPVFTRVVSVFLLLLFARVLVPDSLILALHQHNHTVEKHLDSPLGDKKVDAKHIHCPTDHLFHNTFYTLPIALVLQVFTQYIISYNPSFKTIWKFTFPNNSLTRGPPAIFSLLA